MKISQCKLNYGRNRLYFSVIVALTIGVMKDQESDCNEGKDASLNRRKPYSSGQLHAKNRGSTWKKITAMDVAVLCYFNERLAKIGALVTMKW